MFWTTIHNSLITSFWSSLYRVMNVITYITICQAVCYPHYYQVLIKLLNYFVSNYISVYSPTCPVHWWTLLTAHCWTEWEPVWSYIPATGAGEEDTLWRCPNIPRIIWTVSYPCHLIGRGTILQKWSLVFWHTVQGCPPLPSGRMKYNPGAMSVFSSRIQQCYRRTELNWKQARTDIHINILNFSWMQVSMKYNIWF